jgi:hypothetical protein
MRHTRTVAGMGFEKALLVLCGTGFWAAVAHKGFGMNAGWTIGSAVLLLLALIGLVQLLHPTPDQPPTS